MALRWALSNVYGIQPGERMWAASDPAWVVGSSWIVWGPALGGATSTLYEGKPVGTPDAASFWRVLKEHRINAMFAGESSHTRRWSCESWTRVPSHHGFTYRLAAIPFHMAFVRQPDEDARLPCRTFVHLLHGIGSSCCPCPCLYAAPTALRAIKKVDPDGAITRQWAAQLPNFREFFVAGERCDPDTWAWAEKALG